MLYFHWASNCLSTPSQSRRAHWVKCDSVVDCIWNVMAHAQKPDFVFRQNGRVHLNRRRLQFSRLLAAEVCASAVVMVVTLDTPCSEVVWRVLSTHSISPASPSLPLPCVTVCHQVSTGLYTSRATTYKMGSMKGLSTETIPTGEEMLKAFLMKFHVTSKLIVIQSGFICVQNIRKPKTRLRSVSRIRLYRFQCCNL
jgi:hypothetical protein